MTPIEGQNLRQPMEPGQNITTELWSMDEAAKYLGKTTAALRNGYKRWGVPFVKFGGQIMFTKELLDEYIEKNTVRPTA